MVTGNGAGFPDEDVIVNDSLRADYIRRHVGAMQKAKRGGADLKVYFVWNGWDNFKWVVGYTK